MGKVRGLALAYLSVFGIARCQGTGWPSCCPWPDECQAGAVWEMREPQGFWRLRDWQMTLRKSSPNIGIQLARSEVVSAMRGCIATCWLRFR